MRHTADDAESKYEAPKPKIDPTKKVTRYFPGQKPKFDEDDEDGSRHFSNIGDLENVVMDSRLLRLGLVSSSSTAVSADKDLAPRRRRVFEATVVEESDSDKDSDVPRRATIDDGEVLDGDAPLVQALEKDEDEEDIAARRARIRERMRAQSQRQQEHQHEVIAPASSSTTKRVATVPVVVDAALPAKPSNRYESDSEYETDADDTSSSEEEMMKPIFVPKSKRITIIEESLRQEEERRKVEKEMQRRQEKKLETRQLVADSIRKMEDKAELDMTDTGSDAGVPDDTDDPEDDIEFENWKLREMTRLKRDAALREARMAEKVDLERRRNMTDEERLAEDTAAGKFTKEKSSRKFLQKYYHKGAFYMDETSIGDGDVRARDYSEPTLEDKFNYEALPEVLQVKNFGKRGRTKYTHLLDQDTTAKTDYMVDKRLLGRYLDKRGGVGDIDSAGRLSKKPKS